MLATLETLTKHAGEFPPALDLHTSIRDGLNGSAPHIAQRTNLVVVAKSPIHRIRAFARGVYPPASQFEAWFPSTAHTSEHIARTIEAAAAAFAEVS